ncbi:MAG: DUF58 domain-containing protein [Cyanobacteria bacterium SZAS LIN-3]|nr:DUF58 domain-containing protein [Cyanobacteria bacterium SZAS LIN-3]MBS2010732.1 DUF58 domain-containing protein [Cyanobacteria bacterium SZAS TMP-1]
MSNKITIEELIEAVEARAIQSPIPIRFRSSQNLGGAGERNSRSRGFNGFDLVTQREYQHGDDVKKIDWAATARSGGQKIFVSQFYEPREVKFYILVDSKLTMDFGSVRTTKRMLAAELAASILKSARKTNDKVGYITYSEDRIESMSKRAKFVGAMKNEALRNIIEPGMTPVSHEMPVKATNTQAEVIDVEGLTDQPGEKLTGLQQALRFVRRQSKSLVFVISDFIDLNEAELTDLASASARHDVVCMHVQDRRERELPDTWGVFVLEDIRKGARKAIWLWPKWWPFQRRGSGVREQFTANFNSRRSTLIEFFKDNNIKWEEFSTEEGTAATPKLTKLFADH